jgi:organic radical activating enzyme
MISSDSAIGFYIGDSCNIRCAHCATDSSPDISLASTPETVIDALCASILMTPGIDAVHVSGGEPFVHKKSLYYLSTSLLKVGKKLWVNTNGFWATSLDSAIKMLEDEMPGVNRLYLSTDTYHQAFVPLERIGFAALAATKLNIEVVISIATTSQREEIELSNLRQVMGRNLEEKVFITTFPLESAGRGVNLEEAHWREHTSIPPKGLCSQIRQPVVMPDGKVSACCNTIVSRSLPLSPLWVGDITDIDIGAVHSGDYEDPLLWGIRTLGPADVLALIDNIEGQDSSYRCGNVCDVCSSLMSNPVLAAKARESCRQIRSSLQKISSASNFIERD